ncbi:MULTISPECIES: DUF2243 domain-containing protein [unclassified Knoellia]|uniref:DUF2243 domain-containing protein n=1 Tax=Knoellia altitudinis TaxID=3404795 RepID=UPI0036065ED8
MGIHLPATTERLMPSKASGLLFGLGLGGFVDGIILHQVLQWHHMVSDVERYPMTTLAGLEVNTLADGFFHLATWFLVLAGSVTAIHAWRAGRVAPSWSFHFGLVLCGWGVFNVVEGLVNHHLLGIHHVRDDLGGPLSWDVGFLLLGVLLIIGGWLLHNRGLARMRLQASQRLPNP